MGTCLSSGRKDAKQGGPYLEFWRTKTWEERLAELKETPENWAQNLLEFSALLYDQMDCPEDLTTDAVIEIGDEALRLAIEYSKEDWKWSGAMLIASVDSVGFADSDMEDGDESIRPPKWLITEGTGLNIEELRVNFLMSGGRLKSEYKSPLYSYLRSKSDVLNCEILGEGVDSSDSTPAPVPEELPTFAEMVGGEEGFFLKFSGIARTYRDRDYRLHKFNNLAASHFPHP